MAVTVDSMIESAGELTEDETVNVVDNLMGLIDEDRLIELILSRAAEDGAPSSFGEELFAKLEEAGCG